MSVQMETGDEQPRLGIDEDAASGAAGDDLTYERASGRIEEIIRRLDSGEAGLRETLELVAEGRRLVEFCAAELDAVGRGLEELRLDELIGRLERGGEAGGGGLPGTGRES